MMNKFALIGAAGYISPDCVSRCNQYVIRVCRRDRLVAYLREKSISCEIYYCMPIHIQECFSINFGRVCRYIAENPDLFVLSHLLCSDLPCFFCQAQPKQVSGSERSRQKPLSACSSTRFQTNRLKAGF